MVPTKMLRRARLAAGLTYREVGDAAALDRTAIAHYEAHRGKPSPDALRRWQAALAKLLAERSRQIAAVLETL